MRPTLHRNPCGIPHAVLTRGTALLLLLCAVSASLHAQATFRSVSNGAWESASTWQILSGGDSNGIPDTNDIVTVSAGTVVTVGATTSGCANLTVAGGGMLQLTNTGNLQVSAPGSATINGTLTITSSGTLTKFGSGADTLYAGAGSTISISGTAAFPALDVCRLDVNSTVQYSRAGTQNLRCDFTYGNLTLGGSGVKTATPIPPDTAFHCDGTLTVGSGVNFDVSTNILRILLNGNVVNLGTLDASVGITALWMNGPTWTNNGAYLPATDSTGYGYQAYTTFKNCTIAGTPVAQSFQYLAIDGSVSAENNLFVKRDLVVLPGATFNGGTSSHTVKRNWVNNGTFVPATSTVTFNDTSAQSIGASSFYNLVLNNAKGASLTGDVTIVTGGVLTLTNGNLSTQTHSLIVSSTDPAAIVAGSGTATGTVTRAILAGSTGTYRFFAQNAYIIPSGTGNPTSITATMYPGTNPPNLPVPADTSMTARRYYTTVAAGAGAAFTATVRLPYLQSEVRGIEANYSLWCYTAGTWGLYGFSGLDTASNFVEQSGLPGSASWAIGEIDMPLPIQLASFSAAVAPASDNVGLQWKTLSETNNFGFTIERSATTPDRFAELPSSFVPGNGTTLLPNDYTWTDRNVPAGVYFYRLCQKDMDGTVHHSDATKVDVVSGPVQGKAVSFALEQNYPNPFNPETEIRFTVEQNAQTTLVVYNAVGQIVTTLFAGAAVTGQEYVTRFNANGLATGVYFCRLQSGAKSEIRKMILMR